MAATTLTAADLLLIIVPLLVPLLATMVGLFLHNNRLIHTTSRETRKELHERIDKLSQEGTNERAAIRLEGKEGRAEIRASLERLAGDVARSAADVALIKGVILGTDALRQSVAEQDVA